MSQTDWQQHLIQIKNQQIDWISKLDATNTAAIELANELTQCMLDNSMPEKELIERLHQYGDSHYMSFLEMMVPTIPNTYGFRSWLFTDPFIQGLVHRSNISSESTPFSQFLIKFISSRLVLVDQNSFDAFVHFLEEQDFSNQEIVEIGIRHINPFFKVQRESYSRHNKPAEAFDAALTPFGEYVVPFLEEKAGFLGIAKFKGLFDVVDKHFFGQSANPHELLSWFRLLYDHYPNGIQNRYEKFLIYERYQQKEINLDLAFFMLQVDPQKHEQPILSAIQQVALPQEDKVTLFYALDKALDGKYDQQIREINEAFLTNYNQPSSYFYERSTWYGPMTSAYFNFLADKDQEEVTQRISRYIQESLFVSSNLLNYLVTDYKGDALPLLLQLLKKEVSNQVKVTGPYFHSQLFKILANYDLAEYLDDILGFLVVRANRQMREEMTSVLMKYPDQLKAGAQELLQGKTVNERVVGAMILSNWETDETEKVLNDAIDGERNDDTRDIMLESLKHKRFAKPYSLEQVKEMVEQADSRKKLSKWNEKWLNEDELPAVYTLTGEVLDARMIRFIFYRMKRAKGINSDIEARQLLVLIDREKSSGFSKLLLKAFQDSNSDTKIKHYLTIAGLIGNDEITNQLHSLFTKNLADKRMKMAQYVVGALAMVGTDKALRKVETIYRKLANKRPQVSLAAKEALDAAAEELGITMDQLSDRIIPDFGFEDLYRTFEADGETYRAFISTDFKLNFLNDDNKIRKSAPKGTDKELVKEFKEIEKEIRDVIKSQSVRLEKYMVEARQWPVEEWKTFFFENPIMFVYALQLVWGVYDDQGVLIQSFYCAEDSCCYDLEDEEVELEADQYIRILHPIDLSESELESWKDKLYETGLNTVFPIVERAIFHPLPEEIDESKTKLFYDRSVPKGADHVNTFLVKRNWVKSTGDGGMSEFVKLFKDGELKAYANIEGPAAFYQGGNTPAKVFGINFYGKNWQDKVSLKDVPKIFYSEVMNDIALLLEE